MLISFASRSFQWSQFVCPLLASWSVEPIDEHGHTANYFNAFLKSTKAKNANKADKLQFNNYSTGKPPSSVKILNMNPPVKSYELACEPTQDCS